ncbi:MAG TPA: Hsp70 family protein, partial [Phytomonospora sp.]
EGAVATTRAVVRAAKLPPERIAGVFLVGGASRMPLVATMLHRAMGVAPTVIEQPELVVAQGAAVSAPAPVAPPRPRPVAPPPPRPAPAKRRLDWRWRAAIALAILVAASILVTQLTKVN